jgi:iron complex transport system substrate-binding protein
VRIVSLLPSLTEICCALGLEAELVAVTHECDFPPRVRTKPKVTRSVLPPGLSHGEIDAAVRALVQSGLPLYELDLDLLRRLQPELILTQALCPVCAASYEDVVQIARSLPRRPLVVSVEPHTLGDVLDSIRTVGEQAGRRLTATAVIASLEHRMARVRRRLSDLRVRPGIVCLEWLDPPMVAGHWVPEMVALAGGRDLLGRAAHPSFTVTWDDVRQARPEVLVLMPCGYDLAGSRAMAAVLSQVPGSTEIPAVASGRVYAVDASSYFSRPGPRLVTGLELLAAALHPAAVSPSGWPAAIAPVSQAFPERVP